jgi:hypothetical protein
MFGKDGYVFRYMVNESNKARLYNRTQDVECCSFEHECPSPFLTFQRGGSLTVIGHDDINVTGAGGGPFRSVFYK